MLCANEIIQEAERLSMEDKLAVVDSLLNSISPADPEIERKWTELALRRLDEINSGAVKPIPIEEVFAKMDKRFGK